MPADTRMARSRARDLLAKHALLAPAVPVDKLIKWEKAILQYVPLDEELSGMAFIKDGQAVVAVNALHHPNRQRFTMAHELAHICLHRALLTREVHVDTKFPMQPEVVRKRDALAASGTDDVEIEANAFASELLMPQEWVGREISGGWDIDDEEKLRSLARKFKVSLAAMQFRLLDLV